MLWISSDGDDRRIFSGFEFFSSGIFFGQEKGKFGKYFFGWFDLIRDISFCKFVITSDGMMNKQTKTFNF